MKKTIQSQVSLLSGTDKIFVPVQINYDDDDNAVCTAEIELTYNGKLYQGTGTANLWVDAFAVLQSRLPQNVMLACCMTCRHGNMCPYGNTTNQLFCTKGINISSKEDMIRLFDHTDPFKEKAVHTIDFCDSFEYQHDGYYTYNDYLYRLNRVKQP